jgi:hypothetical protein
MQRGLGGALGLVLEIALVFANALLDLEPEIWWPLAVSVGILAAVWEYKAAYDLEQRRSQQRSRIWVRAKADVYVKIRESTASPPTDLHVESNGKATVERSFIKEPRPNPWPVFLGVFAAMAVIFVIGWLVVEWLPLQNP